MSAAVAQPRTIDPTRFEEAILAFEAEAKASMPPEGAILVTGSSSIRRWSSMEADLAPLTVIPRGFGGSAMADVLHYVDRLIIPYKPRAVVIYEGDNDTGMFGVPPMTIAGELKQIIGTIHQALPETRIYVMSVKPRPGAGRELGQGTGDQRPLPADRRQQRQGPLHRRRDAVPARGRHGDGRHLRR